MGGVFDLALNAKVCNDTDCKTRDIHVSCRYHLRGCRHSDSIGAYGSEIAVLRRGLKSRTGCREIDALFYRNSHFFCNGLCLCDQVPVICRAHIGEARANAVIIRAYQWIWQEADMVSDNHDVTYPEGRIGATGSV